MTAAIRSSDVALRTTCFFLHSVGPLNPGNLHGNQYKYIRDLQALEAHLVQAPAASAQQLL